VALYSLLAPIYDGALERLYAPARRALFAKTPSAPRGCIVDLACGTGQNFPFLLPRLSEGAVVVGIDANTAMINRAMKKVLKAGWNNATLFEGSCDLLLSFRDRPLPPDLSRVDEVVCTLGFSVFDNPQEIFDQAWELLQPGGEMLLMDVHAESWNPQKPIVEWMAGADLKRRSWEMLEKVSETYAFDWLPGSPLTFGGRLWMARGKKG
jgi:demethylmenaquinone methyltransferase/2-methoxy-6-polyprenyl-1,4-benzoquinol methylase